MNTEQTITKVHFDAWWERFRQLAAEIELPIGDAQSYAEYFADGDSPEDALATELGYWDHDEREETP